MDRVADLLRERGFVNVLVSAGGDVVARGSRLEALVGRPAGPRGPGITRMLPLVNQAISTAGDYERYFEVDGVRLPPHHRSAHRVPARGTRSVTVIADAGA